MNYSANIDKEEVAKFDNMANDWWQPDGPCAPLHILNPVRLKFILDKTQLANKDILDVGCGAGILTESLAQGSAKVSGIDASIEVIEAAKMHAQANNLDIHYQAQTIEDFAPGHLESFDIITCMELIEHVPDPAKLIADCASLLKPGGDFFISTLNRTFKAYVFAIIGAEYVLNILPKNTHDYKKFIRPAELMQMMSKAGLHLKSLTGLKFDPFTKSAKLYDNVAINYLAHAIKE